MIVDKPIIYLYPKEEIEVSVKLDLKGKMIFSYPQYDNGWTVTASPDGDLSLNDRNYYYLFWEGEYSTSMMTEEDLNTGFVIKGSETQEFFQKVLPQMGLNSTEYNEFIVYWTPLMQNNRYNFIHFKFTEEYEEEIAGIEVSPKPDAMFRMFMVYQPLERKRDVVPQQIETIKREGFTLIEWGGSKYTGLTN